MKIHVLDVKYGEATRKELRKAAEFYASQLMTSRLSKSLTIFIRIINPDDNEFGVDGNCSWLDDPYRPKEFGISIKGKGVKDMLTILAHEMVHVKQYARGELRDLLSFENYTVNFRGTRYRHIIADDPKYMNQPWEVEAFGLEENLYKAYKKYA